MKVRELIEMLSQFDPDCPVFAAIPNADVDAREVQDAVLTTAIHMESEEEVAGVLVWAGGPT